MFNPKSIFFVLAWFVLSVLIGCTLPRPSTPLTSSTPPAPNAGFIVYVSNGALYRQDMNEMVKDGAPHALNIGGRYPSITPDGKFIYFSRRRSFQDEDEFVIADNQGRIVWSSRLSGCGSLGGDMNYPRMISYDYDPNTDKLSAQLLGACTFPSGFKVGFNVLNISANPLVYSNSPDAWINAHPLNGSAGYFSGGVENAANAKTFFGSSFVKVISTGPALQYSYQYQGNINFGGGIPAGPCSPAGVISRGDIYVGRSSREHAGHTNGISPIGAYKVLNAFAPSISADEKWVLFNSDTYKQDLNRGEELMAVSLPADLCNSYEIVRPPGPVGPNYATRLPYMTNLGTIKVLNSGVGDEYAQFATNTGHAYVMHRHNDPEAGANSALYIAPDLDTPAIRLNPNTNVNQSEGTWFYQ